MSSPSAVACREIFDENSQPSAEEISDYAQQLGIDPESESHLLSLARDGLMQALPAPWKAFYDEKLETHYYYNEDTKKTQWEHPLDNVYRELVKKVRDASVVDDTCASVQELLTSEENTKNLERVETKVESDEELSTDSENHQSDVKEATTTLTAPRRLAPLGRPPLSPLTRMDKKLGDMRISPLRRSAENPTSKRTPDSPTCKPLLRNISDRDLFSRPSVERPKLLFKQQSEVIDLKMSVLSPEEESYPGMGRMDRALPLSGRSSMFLRVSKSDLPSPDTEKSLPLDSVTKSDPPKGILREKISDSHHRRPDSASAKHKNTSFEDDRKSVRFKLECLPDPPMSPSSNSSSEPNDKPTSVISAARPPLPPRQDTVTEPESPSGRAAGRRVLRPPPADYIKPDLFQKNFGKICDLLRPDDGKEPPLLADKDRPRSPMIPQKNKISINLMESIESETSIDSPDREFANLDLNDLDESNDPKKPPDEPKETNPKEELSRTSDKSNKSDSVPQIKVPSLELPKNSDTDSKSIDDSKMSKSSFEKIKMSPLSSEMRSPRLDYNINKVWSPLSTFKPLSKTLSPTLKPDSKGLTSPRLDGVIISQGKSSSDNVVVVYQFETNDESPKPIKSPLIPDMGRDMIERSKTDERRRLDLSLQKELESIRAEWSAKERKMRAELQEELKELEEKFLNDKQLRLSEQASRHQREMEEALAIAEKNHQLSLQQALQEIEDRYNKESEIAEQKHAENMQRLKEQYRERLVEQQEQLEIENERALSILQEQFQASLKSERAAAAQRSRDTARADHDQHAARLQEMRLDYRAEVERLRTQHLCHVSELRARLAAPRDARDARDARDKYQHLKEKYHKLKQDVKMSIERRNKRREMSMTTGSETEKSNSHKANPSLERCKELNETSVSACIEPEPRVINSLPKNNDNETSASESNQRTVDNNNQDWKIKRDNAAASRARAPRRAAVAFREPHRDTTTLRDDRALYDKDAGATTDFQDSSDATTADEKPKENVNGPGRRRCFTRLKSASTSRLNYSPNRRGEGWSSPLEALRLQLRKLDDLEDQFPDLACQPAYSLRYPFTDLGSSCGDSAELEFVRHRALVEREGMRRARDALRDRRRALRDRQPGQESREVTELEVGLHRARALLQEKDIRLRHIERALAALAPPPRQEATSSSGSSGSAGPGARGAAGGAVLRSLRALHADVRDIWRALDARRAATASPETSSCNAATTSQTRLTLSAPEPMIVPPDASDAAVSEKARGLRAWLQTAP